MKKGFNKNIFLAIMVIAILAGSVMAGVTIRDTSTGRSVSAGSIWDAVAAFFSGGATGRAVGGAVAGIPVVTSIDCSGGPISQFNAGPCLESPPIAIGSTVDFGSATVSGDGAFSGLGGFIGQPFAYGLNDGGLVADGFGTVGPTPTEVAFSGPVNSFGSYVTTTGNINLVHNEPSIPDLFTPVAFTISNVLVTPPAPTGETNCDDLYDNNNDGNFDCDDLDCIGDSACTGTPADPTTTKFIPGEFDGVGAGSNADLDFVLPANNGRSEKTLFNKIVVKYDMIDMALPASSVTDLFYGLSNDVTVWEGDDGVFGTTGASSKVTQESGVKINEKGDGPVTLYPLVASQITSDVEKFEFKADDVKTEADVQVAITNNGDAVIAAMSEIASPQGVALKYDLSESGTDTLLEFEVEMIPDSVVKTPHLPANNVAQDYAAWAFAVLDIFAVHDANPTVEVDIEIRDINNNDYTFADSGSFAISNTQAQLASFVQTTESIDEPAPIVTSADFAISVLVDQFTPIQELDFIAYEEISCLDADLNNDFEIDTNDLSFMLSQWGGSGPADLNSDGAVNSEDFGFLMTQWGQRCYLNTDPAIVDCGGVSVNPNEVSECITPAGINFATSENRALNNIEVDGLITASLTTPVAPGTEIELILSEGPIVSESLGVDDIIPMYVQAGVVAADGTTINPVSGEQYAEHTTVAFAGQWGLAGGANNPPGNAITVTNFNFLVTPMLLETKELNLTIDGNQSSNLSKSNTTLVKGGSVTVGGSIPAIPGWRPRGNENDVSVPVPVTSDGGGVVVEVTHTVSKNGKVTQQDKQDIVLGAGGKPKSGTVYVPIKGGATPGTSVSITVTVKNAQPGATATVPNTVTVPSKPKKRKGGGGAGMCGGYHGCRAGGSRLGCSSISCPGGPNDTTCNTAKLSYKDSSPSPPYYQYISYSTTCQSACTKHTGGNNCIP